MAVISEAGGPDSFQLEYIVANEYIVKQVICKEREGRKGDGVSHLD